MKKFLLFLIFALSFSTIYAQTTTYACQYVDANGFEWKNNRWARTGFKVRNPFFLKYNSSNIDPESAFRVFFKNGSFAPYEISCVNVLNAANSCITVYGQSLVFNKENLEGATSQLLGSTEIGVNGRRDTVSVELFTCQKM